MGTPVKHLYQFGPFRLDEAERRLLRDGAPVPLTPKAFDTLLVLVRRSGRVVGKDELLGEVWPDTFVEEGAGAQHLRQHSSGASDLRISDYGISRAATGN